MFLLSIPCTPLKSAYFPTNAPCDTTRMIYINSYMFGTEVPSSGSYYREGVKDNLPI
jgi:hypothetical protein